MAKILLVEDDKSLREIYGVRLQAEGYDITSAGDGEEALALAIKERPDLIVSDVMMPKISGFDMLDILRSTTETKGIRVIMMTALSSEDQRARGEQLGADRYLVKSQVGIEDVVRAVHEVLGDAPVAQAQNAFAAPAPSAVPRPAPTATVPAREPAAMTPSAPVAPAPQPAQPAEPAPVAPMPVAPMPEPTVAPEPTPSVQQPVSAPTMQPVTPMPTPTPAPAAAAEEPSAAPAMPPVEATPSITEPTPAPAPFTLPEPTAPFSTQRPAGLADRIIEPLTREEPAGAPIADLMSKELETAPEGMAAATPTPAAEPSGLEFEETPRAEGTPPAAPAA
jgi:CheY-like chemotaxis protein